MKVVIHDLGHEWDEKLKGKCDRVICADGKYAACQGCFKCWTKHPAECFIRDSLNKICRVIGAADDLVVISENCYGGLSPSVKNVFDRGIGDSTPLSTYIGKQMHHVPRYGRKHSLQYFIYGDVNEGEKETLMTLAERNRLNMARQKAGVVFLKNIDDLKGMAL